MLFFVHIFIFCAINIFFFSLSAERRKRWSDSYKGVPIDSDEDEPDHAKEPVVDEKLKKEEEELNKIASGIGKVFLKDVKKREELKAWKAAHLDPRNASRYKIVCF